MKERLFLLLLALIYAIFLNPVLAQSPQQTKFGIFYSTWYCPSVDLWPKHFNGQIFDTTEALAGRQNWGPIPWPHYWGKPQLGYYCPTNREDILRQHATLLHEAGIDFVFIDSTNHAWTDPAKSDKPQQMIMDPFKKMLSVWSTISYAPKIVPWVPVTADGDMVDFLLGELGKYPILQFIFQGKPLLMTGFNETGFPINYDKLDQLKNNYTIRIMKGIGDMKRSRYPIWYWLQPCASGFKESNGTQNCDQPIAYVDGSLEEIPIAAAYQKTYMSKTDTAVPKLDGRTLQKQFETLFAHPGAPIALIVSWNEFVASRFCLDDNDRATHLNCTDQNDHWSDGNKIFVDNYNKDYSRDIEPAENDKSDLYYKIAKACISLYKQGGRCDANNQSNLCCNTPSFIHGHVDGYRCDNNAWNIAGWATDERDHNRKLTVRAEVYPDNEPYNKVAFTGVAGGVRSDLIGVCPPDGACSFAVKINSLPKSFLDKKIRAHVFGVAPDNEKEIEFEYSNNAFGPCNNLISSPTPTPLPGDLNGDGKVNIRDYNLFVTDFGKTGTAGFIPADIDKSGKVDIFDYNILIGNYGKSQ